jgi:hypothetical protein
VWGNAWEIIFLEVLKRGKDNIKMNIKEIGCGDQRWIKQTTVYVQWQGMVL